MKTLSLCMITKDEEKNIERCIKSVADIADEIIISDTGSTDRTVEIAKSLGATVINYPWNNNFSYARNSSLDVATKEWILCLDADEALDSNSCEKIRRLLEEDNTFEAYYLRLVNVIEGIDIGDAVVLRMFKNKPEYRFTGRIHEQVINSIQSKDTSKSFIGNTDIRILHYGYDPNISNIELKNKRNIEIFNSYEEYEKDAYYYYVLGNEYGRVNNFEKAMESYNISLKMMNPKNRYIYYPYLLLNIAKTYSNAKQFGQEIKFIREYMKKTPQFKDLYFMEVIANVECGNVQEALEALDNYINCPKSSLYEYPNNNFGSLYDIKDLREQLINNVVYHKKGLLSGLIILDNYKDSVLNTIKIFNGIVDKVVVIMGRYDNLEMDKIKNLGANVFINKDKSKQLSFGLKQCKGNYVILIESGDVLTYENKKALIELLEKSRDEAFRLINMNMLNGEYTHIIKVIKNNKKVKSIGEYESILKSNNKKIIDSYICINHCD